MYSDQRYKLSKNILYDKIARLREPIQAILLVGYFFRCFVIYRTLDPGKISPVKNNYPHIFFPHLIGQTEKELSNNIKQFTNF